MVKVREDQPLGADGDIDLTAWVTGLSQKHEVVITDPEGLVAVCQWSRELNANNHKDPSAWANQYGSYRIGLEMVEILAELHLDTDSLKAAAIYRAVREDFVTLDEVRERLGNNIAKLIDGVLQMAAISAVMDPAKKAVLGQSAHQLENLRKMLVAMIDDVRVALIKLTERTCIIRAVKYAPEKKRQRVAREVFYVYAPLAHRLGIGHIKWELEDLSFRYLHPNAYKKIAKLLDEKRLDRQEYIDAVMDGLKSSLAEVGIEAEVTGRAKHIYSIWRKMHRKQIDFYQVYDVRAVRVLVPQLRDCYETLGIVHSLWKHIPREFDDYIASPKENGYRSLHTAVIGPEGKVIEVQVRTHQMHQEAELGVCAHWRYKQIDSNASNSYDDKINWLRQVMEWQEGLDENNITDFVTTLGQTIAEQRIYVFTPDGHVVDIAQGATPVDFAYHIHTEVGHRCRGAKVNGRIVPLTYILNTGEQVEILTHKAGAPSRDWLNPNLGYINTPRARAKLLQWFKRQDREHNHVEGKAILEKEFARLQLGHPNLAPFTERLNVKQVEDIYVGIGAGDIRMSQVLNLLQEDGRPSQHELKLDSLLKNAPDTAQKPQQHNDIHIGDVSNLLTHLAGCCKPVRGDDVKGYITVGRGVTVHREDCAELTRLQENDPDRVVEVHWNVIKDRLYTVQIKLRAYDRQGLLRDITTVLANAGVNVESINTLSDRQLSTANMLITLNVAGLGDLGGVLDKLNQLPNVIDTERV